jgi:hypothetical protein
VFDNKTNGRLRRVGWRIESRSVGTRIGQRSFFLFVYFYLRKDGLRVAGRRGSAGVKRREVKRHWGVRMKDKRES